MNRNAREDQFRAYIVYSALRRAELPLLNWMPRAASQVYVFLLDCCLQNVTN